MPDPLTGIILAGGASRRLGGRDKALLHFGDRPLLHLVAGRLANVCGEIILAGGSRRAQALAGDAIRAVPDESPGRGPLAGLQAGLRGARHDFALVVAVDMPFLNPELLAYMAGRPRTYQALVPGCRGRRHPLHAVYARSCLPHIDLLLAQPDASMEELLSLLHAEVLGEEEIRKHDPDLLSCFNLNTPGDLAEARALWRGPR